MSDNLLELAVRIDSQAAISSRHGQMYELEAIATQLRAEHARIHSWAGLMALLDEHYPADVFTGESGDPGPRILALLRRIDELRAEAPRAQAQLCGGHHPAYGFTCSEQRGHDNRAHFDSSVGHSWFDDGPEPLPKVWSTG